MSIAKINKSRWKKPLGIFIAVILVLSLAKNLIVHKAVEFGASSVLGVPAKIGGLSLSLIFQKIHIKNLKVYNPPGYSKDPLLDIPEISVAWDLPQIIQGKIHLRLAVLSLKEVIVIRNKEGKLNVDKIKVIDEALHPKKDAKKFEMLPLSIDVLKLNIGRVIYKDYSQAGSQPVIQVYDIDLKDKTFKDIESVNKLVMVVLTEALKPTALRKAGVFAATTLMGVGFLPAAVFGVVIAKDDATAEFKFPKKTAFKEIQKFIKTAGTLKKVDEATDRIDAIISGCDVTFTFETVKNGKTIIKVKARKYMLPKPNIAAGILYQLKEKLE